MKKLEIIGQASHSISSAVVVGRLVKRGMRRREGLFGVVKTACLLLLATVEIDRPSDPNEM